MPPPPDADARLSVIGRCVFLGTLTGLAAGAVGGESLTALTSAASGGLAIGGILGTVIGALAGGGLAPLVLRRAASSDAASSDAALTTRDRLIFALVTALTVALACLLVARDSDPLRLTLSCTLGAGVGATAVWAWLPWCMAPARPRARPHGSMSP